ncbi:MULTISPECIES: UDP-N-acetylmuramoyl-L-alanyl-D-glutamate--2,6-diaminopimelate ligase [unclassified Halanaerobium]|uniref:UDP-N-acetylmuramoyl-L-alanyl-D-glutamate--2, 6-diaminopimelate ligase n=1 Tax=unclassified Halanaerobium TaxID=2641197 RepID=UPI000DF4BEC3|nr:MULTISPECIES: UDP-N-acetylmuramoyl-L-alanyl-D-glutamate--2,6-diaminopimelate ligase [unclassified Halanaerobium]RCW51377.1 UDP-N-acetylmuramoylalanyl-D-glutamate--2,6-diaminopimelate ligase [Halanaerobium sp. MA284_MarDTE_T2]RCW81424.1 UDP-N-acetylmuramoylalanyl-D-glutamate--2,6-diaminopimelate ligase [Halanaerobium sp. DL-01]
MNLKLLIDDIKVEFIKGNLNKEISDIKYDSRAVKKNDLFAAISGFKTDGHFYIDDALNNGATAVLIEKELQHYHTGITYIKVDNSRKIMALLARKLFNNPTDKIDLIGITGTNGKTTTSFIIYNLLKDAGYKVGLIGTIKNIVSSSLVLESEHTTPESVDLYRYFNEMISDGFDKAVMEVSSHAIDLFRIEGMRFKTAVFTNLTPEHLDYHINLENYREVKSRLFTMLKPNGFAVLNKDDSTSDYILDKIEGESFTYSINDSSSDLYTENYSSDLEGLSFTTAGLFMGQFSLKLSGIFNIYNSLAAILSVRQLGIDTDIIKQSLKTMEAVPGRFEKIIEGQKFDVVVDFAHTPDGMENVLRAVSKMAKKRIIVVFGCGGDRDKSKRPVMGSIAAEYADIVIITNDNPRNESAGQIIDEIAGGFLEKEKVDYYKIQDRKKAIYKAVDLAEDDDFVIILGKGHENRQIFSDRVIELDDRKAAREAIRYLKGV